MVLVNDMVSREIADYLNGYPAFDNGDREGCIIDQHFFGDWFDENGFDLMVGRERRHPVDPEYLEACGLSEQEMQNLVIPAILGVWHFDEDEVPAEVTLPEKVTMEMAEALLRYIEPAWCRFKGIDHTGYPMGGNLDLAAYLIDDDMLDI